MAQRWLVRAAAASTGTMSGDMTSSAHAPTMVERCGMLNVIDEHTRECLLVRAERRWSSAKVIEALADMMVFRMR